MYLQLLIFIAPYEYECIHLEDASTAPQEPVNKPPGELDTYIQIVPRFKPWTLGTY
jgi:hypothetical protein